MTSTLEDHYSTDCPFCTNAAAYPPSPSSIPINPDRTRVEPNCFLLLSNPHVLAFLDIMPMAPGHLLLCPRKHYKTLADMYVPPGTATQDWRSRREVQEAKATAEELGRWMPVISRALCKVTGVEDWNVVQNNGARAAQVVGHVHFHFIPRYQEGRGGGSWWNGSSNNGGFESAGGKWKGHAEPPTLKSWRMFGKGLRGDLDEEDGDRIAERLREALREEVGEAMVGGKAKL
jgi:diadenosine tetraphosphate (Ap4A) HIT family hydrolase